MMKAGNKISRTGDIPLSYFFVICVLFFCFYNILIVITRKLLELSKIAQITFFDKPSSMILSAVFDSFQNPFFSVNLILLSWIIFFSWCFVLSNENKYKYVFWLIFIIFVLFLLDLYITKLYFNSNVCKSYGGDLIVLNDWFIRTIQVKYTQFELLNILETKILNITSYNDEYLIWEYSSSKFVAIKRLYLNELVALKCETISDLISLHSYMLKSIFISEDNLRPSDLYVKFFSDSIRLNSNDELTRLWIFVGDFIVRSVAMPICQYLLTIFDQDQIDTFWRYISPQYHFDITNVRRGPHVPQDSYFDRLTNLRQNFSALDQNYLELIRTPHYNNIFHVWYGLFLIAKRIFISLDNVRDWLTYQSLFYPGLGFHLEFNSFADGQVNISYFFNVFFGSKKLLMWIDYFIPGISKYFIFIPFPKWFQYLPNYGWYEPHIILFPYNGYVNELSLYPTILTEDGSSRDITLLEYYRTVNFNKFLYYTIRSFQLEQGIQYREKFYSYYIYITDD